MTQDNSIDKAKVLKSYYESGALLAEIPYVNGRMHGVLKRYYESGALWGEIPYVNGKMHGIEKEYYESGALKGETPYVNGQRHGVEKHYDKNKLNIDCLTLYDGYKIIKELKQSMERYE